MHRAQTGLRCSSCFRHHCCCRHCCYCRYCCCCHRRCRRCHYCCFSRQLSAGAPSGAACSPAHRRGCSEATSAPMPAPMSRQPRRPPMRRPARGFFHGPLGGDALPAASAQRRASPCAAAGRPDGAVLPGAGARPRAPCALAKKGCSAASEGASPDPMPAPAAPPERASARRWPALDAAVVWPPAEDVVAVPPAAEAVAVVMQKALAASSREAKRADMVTMPMLHMRRSASGLRKR